jgi:lysophospholipase L1-like esterase
MRQDEVMTMHTWQETRIRRRMIATAIHASAVALVVLLGSVTGRAQGSGTHWVGTWATALVSRPQAILPPAAPPAAGGGQPAQPAQPTGGQAVFENQTLRQIVHTSVGGSRVRVVLSNAFGTTPLPIGAAHVARRESGAAIIAATAKPLTFGGQPGITIPPGASAVSDPADLQVPALSDLAIDLYLPADASKVTMLTAHNGAWQTNYVSQPGNHTGSTSFPVAATVPSWFFIGRVEVMAPSSTTAVVAFGDSITDGTRSTNDANSRWPDYFAKRLMGPGGMPMGVLNLGIGGNRVLADAIPTPAYNAGIGALARLDRDVLSHTGATHVVVLEGINDIRGFAGVGAPRQPVPTADEMIAGYRQIIARARAHGLKVIGATLTPYNGSNGWNAEDDAKRQAVNRWIRTGNAFDGVIDFDAAVRDASDQTKMQEPFSSSDHLHPSDAGYEAMAKAVDLKLFGR